VNLVLQTGDFVAAMSWEIWNCTTSSHWRLQIKRKRVLAYVPCYRITMELNIYITS